METEFKCVSGRIFALCTVLRVFYFRINIIFILSLSLSYRCGLQVPLEEESIMETMNGMLF